MKFIKNSIDLSSRLYFGMEMIRHQGEYGYVSQLSKDLGVCRWFLYFACRDLWIKALSLLSSECSVPNSLSRCQNLEEQVLCLYLECEASLESIQSTIENFTGRSVGTGTISEILNAYGGCLPQSDEVNESKVNKIVLNVDEMFAVGNPILVSVNPASLFIHEIQISEKCDTDTWRESFEAILPKKRSKGLRVVSDGALPLKKNTEMSGEDSLWTMDHFHIFQPLTKYKKRLEERAFYWMRQEGSIWERILKTKDHKRLEELESKLNLTEEALRIAIIDYESFTILLRWLKEELWWIDEQTASIRLKERVAEEIDIILELMNHLNVFELPRAVERLRDYRDDMLNFLEDAPQIKKTLQSLMPHETVAQAFLLLYSHWSRSFSAQGKGKKKCLKEADFWKRALIEELGGEEFERQWMELRFLLDDLVRSSSLVENVNSRLRRFVYSARGQLNQNRLNLIRYYLNHKIFKRGKRGGVSATALYDKNPNLSHWLDDLREIKAQADERIILDQIAA